MASAAEVRTAIAAKVETLLSAYSAAALGSDLDQRHLRIPAGEVRYQLRAWVGPQTTLADINVEFYPSMAVRLRIHYHLDTGEAEATWTNGGMQTALSSLTDPDWWDTISGVFHIDDGQEPTAALQEIVRVGDVVSFDITTVLTVDPNA